MREAGSFPGQFVKARCSYNRIAITALEIAIIDTHERNAWVPPNSPKQVPTVRIEVKRPRQASHRYKLIFRELFQKRP
jgi:hypothetical protein